MEYESIDYFKNLIKDMRLSRIVQLGYLNAPLTSMFSTYAQVDLFPLFKNNFFENNEKVNFLYGESPIEYARKHAKWRNKVDLVYMGKVEDTLSLSILISTFGAIIRKFGYMIFECNLTTLGFRETIDEYINLVGADFFEIEKKEIDSDNTLFVMKIL